MDAPYKEGDKVWYGGITSGPVEYTCPDCLGHHTVFLKFRDGTSEGIDCPACRYGFEHRGKITTYQYKPDVKQLTIKSVRYDSAADNPWEYMCKETSQYGGGSIHRVSTFFDTKKEAQEYAVNEALLATDRAMQQSIAYYKGRRKHDVSRRQEIVEKKAVDARIIQLEAEVERLKDIDLEAEVERRVKEHELLYKDLSK